MAIKINHKLFQSLLVSDNEAAALAVMPRPAT